MPPRRLRVTTFAIALGTALQSGSLGAQCGPRSLDAPQRRDSLLVSTAWLAANTARQDFVLLHVDHDRASYDAGHIPGARFAGAMTFTVGDFELPPVADLVTAVERLGISSGTRVVVYGEPWHLGRVLLALDYLGHGDHTAVLDGGLPQWRAEGRPVTRDAAPRPAPATFTPRVRSDVVVDAQWLRARLDDPRFVVIDTRTTAEYEGGHIPGATLLEWNRTFTRPREALDGTTSLLVSAQRLLALFQQAGVRPGRDPVLYCTVGLRASHIYFVARYLGFTPRIYDGSINDWSARRFPLVTGSAPGGTR